MRCDPTDRAFAMASSDSDEMSFVDVDDCPDPESGLQAADEDEAADVHTKVV